jgi:hypothetical protein
MRSDEEMVEEAIALLPLEERGDAWSCWFLTGNLFVETIKRPHVLPEYHLACYSSLVDTPGADEVASGDVHV